MRHRDFGLLALDQHRATAGLTLFSPIHGRSTYLIGMRGDVLHQWEHPLIAGPYAYLLEGSTATSASITIFAACRTATRSSSAGRSCRPRSSGAFPAGFPARCIPMAACTATTF